MEMTQINLKEVVLKKEEITQVWRDSLPKKIENYTGKVNVYIEPRPKSDSFFYAQAEYKNGDQVHFELNPSVVNSLDAIYAVLKQEKVNKIRKITVDFSDKNRVGFWLPYPFQFFSFKEIDTNKHELVYIESENIKAPPKAIVFEKYSINQNVGPMGQRAFVAFSSDNVIFQREPLPGEKFQHSDYLNIEDKNIWLEKFKLAQSKQQQEFISEN